MAKILHTCMCDTETTTCLGNYTTLAFLYRIRVYVLHVECYKFEFDLLLTYCIQRSFSFSFFCVAMSRMYTMAPFHKINPKNIQLPTSKLIYRAPYLYAEYIPPEYIRTRSCLPACNVRHVHNSNGNDNEGHAIVVTGGSDSNGTSKRCNEDEAAHSSLLIETTESKALASPCNCTIPVSEMSHICIHWYVGSPPHVIAKLFRWLKCSTKLKVIFTTHFDARLSGKMLTSAQRHYESNYVSSDSNCNRDMEGSTTVKGNNEGMIGNSVQESKASEVLHNRNVSKFTVSLLGICSFDDDKKCYVHSIDNEIVAELQQHQQPTKATTNGIDDELCCLGVQGEMAVMKFVMKVAMTRIDCTSTIRNVGRAWRRLFDELLACERLDEMEEKLDKYLHAGDRVRSSGSAS